MKTDLQYPLRSLFWEATLRCNAYCEFCGSRCGEISADRLKKEEVDADTICQCFLEIAKRYRPDKIMINVTGGEPLLREDIFEVMRYAASLGFPWGMVTNGSLITAETVREMKKSGMRTISISLDGLPETHNQLRKIKNGFSKIENAVKLLKQENFLDTIQVTTVVNRKNIDELEALYGCLQKWEVDSWRIAIEEITIANECKNNVSEEYKLYSGEYQLLGIAHTHPGELNTVMSRPDMELHQKMKYRHTVFVSLIVNPHKKELCAFTDSVYSPTDVLILTENMEKWKFTH